MKDIIYSNRFKRDFKRVRKRNRDLDKLAKIIDLLACDMPLPPRCRPHKLSGNYSGCWECHVEPDWLLIYGMNDDTIDIVATGTHADLFK